MQYLTKIPELPPASGPLAGLSASLERESRCLAGSPNAEGSFYPSVGSSLDGLALYQTLLRVPGAKGSPVLCSRWLWQHRWQILLPACHQDRLLLTAWGPDWGCRLLVTRWPSACLGPASETAAPNWGACISRAPAARKGPCVLPVADTG